MASMVSIIYGSPHSMNVFLVSGDLEAALSSDPSRRCRADGRLSDNAAEASAASSPTKPMLGQRWSRDDLGGLDGRTLFTGRGAGVGTGMTTLSGVTVWAGTTTEDLGASMVAVGAEGGEGVEVGWGAGMRTSPVS
jgi:hypothetical protein